MKVLFIVRSTLFSIRGGDTVQVEETARELRNAGVEVEIKKTNERIIYDSYDLLHFFNIIRPADILVHIKRSMKPFVVSTILIDYSAYDKLQRSGITGKLFKSLPADSIEYLKTVCRVLMRKDRLASISYLWKGQRRSIKQILRQTKCVLVQAEKEYTDLVSRYRVTPPFHIIHNGVNTALFQSGNTIKKEDNLVLCVARIEGIKNQYNLIKALNNTEYKLLLIGNAAPNQKDYYRQCQKIAAPNISFINYLPQEQLLPYYAAAKVHVLPSWFEVCGLSSLEAAAMGCRVIITNNGYAASYFNGEAFYCDPSKPESILASINTAMAAKSNGELQKKGFKNYTWQKTAEKTLSVYKKYIA
jgi:glycosyltransferase involved in cell wall biosynthesis